MSRFIESIKLLDGKLYNLDLHEERRSRTLHEARGTLPKQSLAEIIQSETVPTKGFFKCRVVYDEKNAQVDFIPYTKKKIQTLRVVDGKSIEYSYKWEDRNLLNELYASRGSSDDVIIIKNGLVTDSSYANIVFKYKDQWVTPHTYLLNGVMRQHLLQQNKISEREIRVSDLRKFESFKLINALLEFDSDEVIVNNIIIE